MTDRYRILVGYNSTSVLENIFVALEKKRMQSLDTTIPPEVKDISVLPEGYVSFSLYVKGDQSTSNVIGKLWDILPDASIDYVSQNLIITKMR